MDKRDACQRRTTDISPVQNQRQTKLSSPLSGRLVDRLSAHAADRIQPSAWWSSVTTALRSPFVSADMLSVTCRILRALPAQIPE